MPFGHTVNIGVQGSIEDVSNRDIPVTKVPLMKSQLISSAILVLGLSAIPVYGQQKPQITFPPKPLVNVQLIATVKLRGQVVATPLGVQFVPAADGLFRVTTYLRTSPGRQEPALMQIYWTDNYAELEVANIGTSYAGAPNIITIQARARQPVYYSTYVHLSYENVPFPTYDVYSTVELLQQ
ncbi:MAG: hypothetical protein ACR2JB_17735 [Bryobacteraceae bacterium]